MFLKLRIIKYKTWFISYKFVKETSRHEIMDCIGIWPPGANSSPQWWWCLVPGNLRPRHVLTQFILMNSSLMRRLFVSALCRGETQKCSYLPKVTQPVTKPCCLIPKIMLRTTKPTQQSEKRDLYTWRNKRKKTLIELPLCPKHTTKYSTYIQFNCKTTLRDGYDTEIGHIRPSRCGKTG